MLLSRMASSSLCSRFFLLFLHLLLLLIPILFCTAQDCLNEGDMITDDGTDNNNLVSPGKVFELGFFTPDENNNTRRYLGIWYYQSNPKVVVWVANRDKPLLESGGSLVLRNDNAVLLDAKNVAYWPFIKVTVSLTTFSANYTSIGTRRCTIRNGCRRTNFTDNICLNDYGNLILNQRGIQRDTVRWQSFDHPTDTFLPKMDIAQELFLWSGKTRNDPALGQYTFTLQLQVNNPDKLIVKKGSLRYWESDVTTFDPPPQNLFDLLHNNLSELKSYNNTRLVMNSTGQIQFWKKINGGGWSLKWLEPKDRCSLYNVCGNFGSCNSKNGLLCKCLPGFKANSPIKWNSGNYSEGCSPRSVIPCSRNYAADVFLRMPMMKVSIPDRNETVANCTYECLQECSCVAYSCGAASCSGSSNETCLRWNNDPTQLQEEYPKGLTIFIRSQNSDIESNPRGCNPCGAYMIPYPLSTESNCGDPSYSKFHCNSQIGQLNFSTTKGNFKVTSIDPFNQNFSIQVTPANSCDRSFINNVVLSDKDSSSFTFRNCKVYRDIPLLQIEHPFIEVEIGWNAPLGPTCNVTTDCNPWPHTTCKAQKGQLRCSCASKFRWDGFNMKCTRVPFPLIKVVVSCIAGALVVVFACCLIIVNYKRKRRMIEKQGFNEFSKDDTEGIDVPYFDWESILAATNNFADANKLGVGGFGSVYKGKLSDGQDIAVKRLSSVSVQGSEEFRTEVKLIAKLQHRNLVRLVGYCIKASEKILVYEFMPNGSLDSCLYDEKHYVDLDWEKRNDIILGIARGLLYLHQDSRLRIIHRDLKPSNILLDEELNPKISDFGIARIVGGKETHASTGRIVGTYGYMSPEYASDGIFSVKSDVFSFGVVVLETISGKRNSRIFMIEHGLSLLGHAWKLWNDGRGLELMDPKLNESCSPSEVLRCIHIGLLCVQEDPSDRPSMSNVVHMLSGENASLPLAKQPAFMNRKPLSDTASSSSTKDMQEMITISTVGR